jgi:hypothetical protein
MRNARSAKTDEAAAAEDMLAQLGSFTPKLVTLFASRNRDHAALNRAVRERLPKGTRLIGASTGGEIDNHGMHFGGAVLAGLAGDFDVGVGLAEGLTTDATGAGTAATTHALSELGIRPGEANPRKCVGIVIDDAFRYKKEELLLGILEKNQNMVLVGGGAADREQDPAKQSALVHVDDKVVTDAALVAIIRTDAPWAAMRSHWYEPTGQLVRMTKVDDTHTRVLEIDGKPAAKRYAEVLGVEVDELEYGKPKGFGVRPTAMKVGREYFIRAPWKPLPDDSIFFANLVEEGAEYEIMRRGDMVGMTRRFFEEDIPRRVQSPQAALLFHCSGRTWLAEADGSRDKVAETFKLAPTCVGMNVFFEIYCGFSINNTLTSVVFGAS